MEHFEELIEMQEGSNDGVDDTPQGEKTAQPGEILDIEEVNVSFWNENMKKSLLLRAQEDFFQYIDLCVRFCPFLLLLTIV